MTTFTVVERSGVDDPTGRVDTIQAKSLKKAAIAVQGAHWQNGARIGICGTIIYTKHGCSYKITKANQ